MTKHIVALLSVLLIATTATAGPIKGGVQPLNANPCLFGC